VSFRVYHGPVNIAGIGRILADWQREQGNISDFVTYATDPVIVKESHFSWRLDKGRAFSSLLIMLCFFVQCLCKYDLFCFYSGCSLLPFNLDLPFLRLFGKKIVMVYCGSDIRLMEVEKKRNPFWQLIHSPLDGPAFDAGKKRKMRWHKLWVSRVVAPRELYESAAVVFPDKMIERDLWVHNLLDMNAYSPHYSVHDIPLVVHAPSHQGLKGTQYIEQAVQALKEDGYVFEYRRIENMANEEALRVYREEADIIVDQLLLGGFGTLAVEAMYYGKPVVCYLVDEAKDRHFPDVPIVNATIENIKEQLQWLIENPEERRRLGVAGRRYVEEHFDCDKVNQELWQLYETL